MFMKNLPAEFARYSEQQVSDYLALNAGLVAMNLVLADRPGNQLWHYPWIWQIKAAIEF